MCVGIVKNVPKHVVRLNEKENLQDIWFWLENKMINSNKSNVTLKYTIKTTSSDNFIILGGGIKCLVTVYMLKYFRSDPTYQSGRLLFRNKLRWVKEYVKLLLKTGEIFSHPITYCHWHPRLAVSPSERKAVKSFRKYSL